MAEYTTVARVSAELNGLEISASTVPSSSSVTQWIQDASAEVDLMTSQVWGSEAVSSEYYDYDGSGIIRLNNAPIISVSEFLTESSGLNAVATWGSLSEGRTANDSFILYKDEGELQIHGTIKPKAGYQNLCISYIHGYASIPDSVAALTTKIAAKKVIESVNSGSATNEGGTVSVGTITVTDPGNYGNTTVASLDKEIQALAASIGKLKTFRINRRSVA